MARASSFPTIPPQTDEALRLLADLYARRFQGGMPSSRDRLWLARWHAYEWVRDTLYQAQDQSNALAQLALLLEQVEEEHGNHESEASAWRGIVQDAHAQVKRQDAMTCAEDALCGHSGSLSYAQHGVLVLERLDCFGYSALQVQRLATVFDQVPDVQLVLTFQFWASPPVQSTLEASAQSSSYRAIWSHGLAKNRTQAEAQSQR